MAKRLLLLLPLLLARGCDALRLLADAAEVDEAEVNASVHTAQLRLSLLQQRAREAPQGISAPDPDTLEPGFKYEFGQGSGCNVKEQPAFAKKKLTSFAAPLIPAHFFKNPGWNGFCQMNWSVCPDAVMNKDYTYYAKSLGPNWVKGAGSVDKFYCANNGWLKLDIARLTKNFTALREKGKELCRTKYSRTSKLLPWHVGGIAAAFLAGAVDYLPSLRRKGKSEAPGRTIMTKFGASVAAAWNCGLGDLACDLAYCNYAYCEQPDGTIGSTDECEGWDKIHGMPSQWGCNQRCMQEINKMKREHGDCDQSCRDEVVKKHQ